ncbi:hypothetical protein ACFWPK_18785 [Nocardia sp. NPDC058519]|uniref:hypothetical protein n=1 Tax=Nocardia sp. NPDC058519 TaxID=3346535 RepID=UPI003664F250
MLARHAGAARFAFNQSLDFVKTALTRRKTCPEQRVPWTRFDLINAFNSWKKTEAAGRVFTVSPGGIPRGSGDRAGMARPGMPASIRRSRGRLRTRPSRVLRIPFR